MNVKKVFRYLCKTLVLEEYGPIIASEKEEAEEVEESWKRSVDV